MLTTHLKYGSFLPCSKKSKMTCLGKIEICSRIRFVSSIKLGPGDVCNLLLLDLFEENVAK